MMFGFLFGMLSRSRKTVRQSMKPAIELLERRDCPTLHVSLAAQVLPAHQVQLTGSVTGGDNSGVTVNFGGAVNANTTTDASGNFSFTTNQASLGTVTAMAGDSDMASATISVSAPVISALSISYGTRNNVVISGTLTSIDESGRTITFMGPLSGTAITGTNGDFTITGQATSVGSVSASTTDLWGQMSNTPSATIVSNIPAIQNFAAVAGSAGVWHFTGTVVDEYVAGLTVQFGGNVTGVSGQSTTVLENGTFDFSCILSENARGTVTAIVFDWFGQQSQMVFDLVG